MRKLVLVVDDDDWIGRMVRTMLERRGCEARVVPDGRQGLAMAQASPPNLVIADVLLPGLDGWSLLRALRAHPATSLVPVMFLTALGSDEDRILGLRLGADDYLAKPFRLEELDLRVQRIFRREEEARERARRELDAGPEGGVGLRGSLAHLGVSAVLTILEMERKSGILVVRGPRVGRVFMREGRVIAAFAGEGGPSGAEAVYELLTWTEGTFEFTALDVDMEDQVRTSTTHLLMEGARRIDEAASGGG